MENLLNDKWKLRIRCSKRRGIQNQKQTAPVDKHSPVPIILFFHRPTSKQLVEVFNVALRFSAPETINDLENRWTTRLCTKSTSHLVSEPEAVATGLH